MTEFLTDHGVALALACALLAVAYGAVVTRHPLAMSPGNERMREVSAAIQEGASAYLRRQYLIIAAVAVPLVVVLLLLQNWQTALGFVIGHGHAGGGAGIARGGRLLRPPDHHRNR